MDKSDYLAEISKRLTKMFRASKEGYKIPDIDRHRLEGFMHAGIFMQIATPAEISRISDAPGLDGVVNIFLFLVE